MCCFSIASPNLLDSLYGARPRVRVARTRILARRDGDDQLIAYAMSLTAPSAVAMIMPLPVREWRDPHVSFLDLSAHTDLFERLQRLFPAPAAPQDFPLARNATARIAVQAIGAYEASYVPAPADFARLDPRFQLPPGFLTALPDYRDHGFAVFRLNPAKNQPVHPMGIRFRTRSPSRLYFPTVHVHDGEVHPTADFDHTLYWQGAPAGPDDLVATTSVRDGFPTIPPVLDPDAPVVSRTLVGVLPNEDTWV